MLNQAGLNLDDAGRAMSCPLCGSASQDSIEPFNSYEMARCRDCSLVYTALRRIPREQYEEVYSGEADYREMVEVAEKTASGDWGFRQLRWFKRKALRWIETERPNSKLVDVGTGPGTFLLVAKQRGFSVKGVEPTKLAAEKAGSLGVDMFNGVIEDFAANQDEKFDVVTSFEVLEHVPDPISMLKSIRSILKPDGIFVFSVPNLDDPYCLRQTLPVNIPPIHINFFRRQSMRVALEKAGFVTERFATRPIPAASVRNEYGLSGLILRAPMLALLSLLGKSEGNTLLGMARPRA
ncbi:MAG: class I SAM-dependent methyltransferase [Polyangiales bacterium]